jgi:uncharacterized protein (TIGR03083 family)
MDVDFLLRSIASDGATMAEIAGELPPDTAVPSCPGWTMRDLIEHTGIVHRHKAETVAGGWVDESPPRPLGPVDGDLVGWFSDGLDDLLAVLSTADLAQPTYTWCDHDHSASWWVRRMAHETAVHRADAELAAGRTPHLDPVLAADGVDEVLDEMIVGGPAWGVVTPRPQVIRLEAADRRWQLRTATFSGTSPDTGRTYDMPTLVHDPDGVADAVVSTDPATLDLWLWGRCELPSNAVTGEGGLVSLVRAIAAEATS